MREMVTKVYQFEELSDAAKAKARDWFRQTESEMFGQFGELFEPAETAARLLGITFGTHSVGLMSGKTRQESKIWWSGFSSQGDGASFEGSYQYVKGCAKTVENEFPTNTELHQIARELTELQRANGYRLRAEVSTSGREVHEYAMRADVWKGEEQIWYSDNVGDRDNPTEGEKLLGIMRAFAKWIYRGLEAEYEYRLSEEQLDESMIANEYEFDESGKRCICI